MKFTTLILLLFTLSFGALAADLSVSIEHPLKGKRKAYKSVVKCSKSCAWESAQKSGFSELGVFSEDLKALNTLIEGGQIPQKKVEYLEDTYVQIVFKNDEKETSFTLGLPAFYSDTDSDKFNQLNKLITRIEFLIQKQGSKK